MYYLLIMLSVVMFSGCFAFNDIYRKIRGKTLKASFEFSFIGAIASSVFLIAMNGFKFEITPFTLIMALLSALNGFGFTICSFKALGLINLSVYSVFSMLGGMVLPFLQGILFFSEKLTVAKIVCLIFITIALLFTLEKGDKKKGLLYYIGIFTLNGMSGVLSKIFVSAPFEKTSAEGFQILISLVSIVLSFFILFIFFRDTKEDSKSSFLLISSCALSSITNKLANLWLVIALMHVDASVQYPMVTGGTMIVSTIICFFGKNKPTKNELISVAFAFLGMLALFIIPV